MKLEEWQSQIKRGTLEYCLLLMINKRKYYGYEIVQELNKYKILSSTESTVYPILRRLLKDGLLQSTWEQSENGLPPRKYYSITRQGNEYLEMMNNDWNELLENINEMRGL